MHRIAHKPARSIWGDAMGKAGGIGLRAGVRWAIPVLGLVAALSPRLSITICGRCARQATVRRFGGPHPSVCTKPCSAAACNWSAPYSGYESRENGRRCRNDQRTVRGGRPPASRGGTHRTLEPRARNHRDCPASGHPQRDGPHSTRFSGKGYHRSSQASRREDLEIEKPVSCGDCSSFHFHATAASMLSTPLVGHEVVQMGEPSQERLLTPFGMMEAFHHEQLAVDGVMRLIE
jgi:hypothetical protein